MITQLVEITQGFFIILILFFLIKILYFVMIKIYGKTKSFLGVIIEGSEYYWIWRWKKFHNTKKLDYEKIDEYNFERGWTLIPNLKNKLHYAAVINSDKDGSRGKNKINSNKKVLFYGDSFCFGEGVDDEETIPAFFEKKFKNIKSINYGVHGYGIDQQYLFLKDTISKHNPNLTCFIIVDNDFRRNFMDFRDYAKPKFILKDGKIVLTNTPVPKPEDILKNKKLSLLKLLLEFPKHFLIYYGIIEKRERTNISNLILDKIKEETKKQNSELIFIYINDARRNWWYKSYIDSYFIKTFKRKNIRYLYLEEIFGKKKLNSLFDTLSGHFSAEGNKLIAEKLAEYIKSEGIIK